MAATKTFSRRRMIAAMGALPVAALAIPVIADAQTIDAAAWDRAFAEMLRAKAAYEAHDAVYHRVWASHDASAPSMNMIPFRAFPFADHYDVALRMDVEKCWQQRLRAEGVSIWSRDPAVTQARFRAALDKVIEYRRLREANDRRHDWDAINERQDRLCSDWGDTETALLMMPAPHLAALNWKIQHLCAGSGDQGEETLDLWTMRIVRPMLADARRLLNGEG